MNTITDLIQRIEAALVEDPRTQDISFEVINQNGLITLKGQVEKPAVRDAAISITKQQNGVIDVIDEIELILNDEVKVPEHMQFMSNNPTGSNR